ncbi:hypothetical protein MP228_005501 [Amoeboaphelidium protococcarum]|nr:hypothetical protein MP228_005501 [Amoeboaphelidium protococcarum]
MTEDRHYRYIVKSALLLQILVKPVHLQLDRRNVKQFDRISTQALEVLVDLYLLFIQRMGLTCKRLSELSHRQLSSILDIRHALASVTQKYQSQTILQQQQQRQYGQGVAYNAISSSSGLHNVLFDLEELLDFTAELQMYSKDQINQILQKSSQSGNDAEQSLHDVNGHNQKQLRDERELTSQQQSFGLCWLPDIPPKNDTLQALYANTAVNADSLRVEQDGFQSQGGQNISQSILRSIDEKLQALLFNEDDSNVQVVQSLLQRPQMDVIVQHDDSGPLRHLPLQSDSPFGNTQQ